MKIQTFEFILAFENKINQIKRPWPGMTSGEADAFGEFLLEHLAPMASEQGIDLEDLTEELFVDLQEMLNYYKRTGQGEFRLVVSAMEGHWHLMAEVDSPDNNYLAYVPTHQKEKNLH